MAPAKRRCTATARLRKPTPPRNPHDRARGLVGDEHDDTVMLTPPQASAVEVAQSQ